MDTRQRKYWKCPNHTQLTEMGEYPYTRYSFPLRLVISFFWRSQSDMGFPVRVHSPATRTAWKIFLVRCTLNMKAKVLVVTLVIGILAFLLEPNGPLGSFWAPAPTVPEATGIQVPLFILLGVAEAIVFGLGISFLIFGRRWIQELGQVSKSRAFVTYLSIAWLLVNWWPHDSLHIHNGENLNGLLAIEYGFHITLMAAGLIVAAFFLKVLRQAKAPSSV